MVPGTTVPGYGLLVVIEDFDTRFAGWILAPRVSFSLVWMQNRRKQELFEMGIFSAQVAETEFRWEHLQQGLPKVPLASAANV